MLGLVEVRLVRYVVIEQHASISQPASLSCRLGHDTALYGHATWCCQNGAHAMKHRITVCHLMLWQGVPLTLRLHVVHACEYHLCKCEHAR